MTTGPVGVAPRVADRNGEQVVLSQPAEGKATRRPSAVPTRITSPDTAGWVTMGLPVSPVH